MSRRKGFLYTCYALLPLISVILILAISWLLVAIIEIYTNNLTMLNTLNRFSTVKTMEDKKNHKISPPIPGNKLDNTFWFVQVSDIHISKFRSYGQVEDFKIFCTNWLPLIKPSLVLLTGDLTDAKDITKIGSFQYEEEWVTYSSLIKKCREMYPAKWLDIRGNHDSFGVGSLLPTENMYETYGISRNKFERSGVYQHVYNTSFGKYSFNGIDLAPNPGPGRPFNFFGVPLTKTISTIKDVASNSKYNATIWYGHYPLSTTTNPHLLRKLLSLSGVAYLCGHLHTLLDIFPQIHAVHSEGMMELEVGDWKESRKFRVGVFDHDVFSFKDATFMNEPIVVFTNPVDARYIIQNKVPYSRSWNSTHVRFLAFHVLPLSSTTVLIDNKVICENTEVVQNVLHTCKWNPQIYRHGIHNLTVITKDSHQETRTHSIEFSLDGSRPPLSFFSVILLLTDFCTMFRVVFVTSIVLTILVPLAIKKFAKCYYIVLVQDMLYSIFPQFMYFINADYVFWSLIYYNCYLCVGPFSIGNFVPNQIGIAFPYGIFTGGTFIEGSITLLYVSGHMLFFNFFVILYFGELLKPLAPIGLSPFLFSVRRLLFKIIFISLVFYGIYLLYTYWLAYGLMSSVFNSLSTLAAIVVHCISRNISKHS